MDISKIKRYDVITFDRHDKVVVLETCLWNNRKFAYVNEILPDESDITDIYKVMEIHIEDGTLEKVIDVDTLNKVLPIFEKKLQRYIDNEPPNSKRGSNVIPTLHSHGDIDDFFHQFDSDNDIIFNESSVPKITGTGKPYIDNFMYDYFFNCADRLVKWSEKRDKYYSSFEIGSIHVTEAYDKRRDYCRGIQISGLIFDSKRDVEMYMNIPHKHPKDQAFYDELTDWFNIGSRRDGDEMIYIYQDFHVSATTQKELAEFMNHLNSLVKQRYVKTGIEFYIPEVTKGPCYIATAVYGSYDCPEVWTLRRFRDEMLITNAIGRLFVRAYYKASPWFVNHFGKMKVFSKIFKPILNRVVDILNKKGISDKEYYDKK